MADITVTVTNPITRTVTVSPTLGNATAIDIISNRLTQSGSYLESLITVSNAGVSSLNTKSGTVILSGYGNISVIPTGQNIIISGDTGAYSNFLLNSQTGDFIDRGQTGDFAANTGILTSVFYPISSNPNNYITSSQTGDFIGTAETGIFFTQFISHSETGFLSGEFYPLHLNPLGYLTGINTGSLIDKGETGNFVDKGLTGNFIDFGKTGQFAGTGNLIAVSGTLDLRLQNTGSNLLNLINASSAGVSSINSHSGALTFSSAGNVNLSTNGQTFTFSGDTGAYANFISSSQTGNFLTSQNVGGVRFLNITGLNTSGSVILTGAGTTLLTVSGQTIFISGSSINTGNLVDQGMTGNILVGKNQTGFLVDAGLTGKLTGQFYPLSSNPNGYITGINTGLFVTLSQTGNFIDKGQTGNFIDAGKTGNFIDIPYLTGVSGVLGNRIQSTGSFLYSLVQASSAGVSSINSQSGSLTLTGAGDVTVIIGGQTFTISGNTGAYSLFALKNETGNLISYDYLKTTGYFGSTGISNLRFNNNLIIFRGNDTESNTAGYDNSVPSQGINFSRAWLGTLTGLEGGIYGFSTPNWGGGLVFITKFGDGNQTGSGITTLVLQSDQKVSIGTGLALEKLHVFGKVRSESGFFSGITNLDSIFYPKSGNPSGYLTSSNTGNFIDVGMTGRFINNGMTGSFADIGYVNNISGIFDGRVSSTGSFLYGLIQASSAGVSSVNAQSGSLTLTGAGDVSIIVNGQTFIISGNSGSYITNSQTGKFLTAGYGVQTLNITGSTISGNLNLTGLGTVSLYQSGSTLIFSGSGSNINTGLFVDQGMTGLILVGKNQTGNLIDAGATGKLTGQFYPLSSNPSNYITNSQTGNFIDRGQTGNLIDNGKTGQFYPSTNPSGFIISSALNNYVQASQTGAFATTGYVSGISGVLNGRLGSTGTFLLSQISNSVAGVSSVNLITGGLILTGAGNVTLSIIGQTFTFSGAGSSGSSNLATGQVFQKNIYIENPTDHEDLSWFNQEMISLSKVVTISRGTGVTLGWTINQTTDRSITGSLVLSGYSDSITTGNSFLTLVNPTLSGNTFVVFKTQSIGTGLIGDFSVNLIGGIISLGSINGVTSLNSQSGSIILSGQGAITVNTNGNIIQISGAVSTGNFAPSLLISTGLNNYPIVLNNLGSLSGTSSLGWDDVDKTLKIGITGRIFPTNPLIAIDNINNYYQINVQNLSTGSGASSDYILTSNIGTDLTNYLDLGINNSSYFDTGYTLLGPNDGYLYVNGGNLNIGTSTTGKVSFHISGVQTGSKILDISLSGINLISGKSIYSNNQTYSQISITGSNSIQSPIFSGIGSSNIILSGNNVLISGNTLTSFQKNTEIVSTGLVGGIVYRVPVFRSNSNYTLTGIHTNRIGGTSAQVTAFKNNLSGTFHCGYISSSTGNWTSTGTIISGSYIPGDALYVIYSGLAGLPTSISVQFDFTQP